MRAEIEYLTDKFCKNGYDRNTLQKITNNFEKKTRSINNNNNSSTNKQTTNFPWIPKIGPKIRKEIQKFDVRVAFQSDRSLNNILCKKIDKLIPNSHPGLYALKSLCVSVYNGKIKKKIISRSIEHHQESVKCNWSSSRATEYTREYHGHFDWLHPKSFTVKNKYYNRNVRELLKIVMEVVIYGQDKVLNRDNGNFVKVNCVETSVQKNGNTPLRFDMILYQFRFTLISFKTASTSTTAISHCDIHGEMKFS